MKISLGFSPCPNDTFIFDALVHHKIDTLGLNFEVVLADVQTLNQWAKEEKLQASKISYATLPYILDKYVTLTAGSALGKGVGPLLVAQNKDFKTIPIQEQTIAIPGEDTTAHLLFSLAYPQAKKKVFMPFQYIEDAVVSQQVDAGVIIHENRFTYTKKGLIQIQDLGAYWEQEYQTPIPLGGIVAHRSMPLSIVKKLNTLIENSIEYAFAHYPTLSPYVHENAQTMSEDIMRQHIDLYVNKHSIFLNNEGKYAISMLIKAHQQLYPLSPICTKDIFI